MKNKIKFVKDKNGTYWAIRNEEERLPYINTFYNWYSHSNYYIISDDWSVCYRSVNEAKKIIRERYEKEDNV